MRNWQPIFVFLPGKSHGQRSLTGYSPWVIRESAMTKHICMHSLLTLDFFFLIEGTVCVLCSVISDSLQSYGLKSARLLSPWDSPGKNTGVGCHAFLQQIFPTQELNPGLLHWLQILYHQSHQGSPSVLTFLPKNANR